MNYRGKIFRTKDSRRSRANDAACSGFMLIELCIAIAIVGLFMAGLMEAYKLDRARKWVAVDKERQETIRKALQDFVEVFNRLPCAANPALPQTDPNYGREITAGGCTDGTPSPVGQAFRRIGRVTAVPPRCTAVVAPCTAVATPPGQHVPGAVRVGAVPVRTLNLSDVYMADASNRLFIYAVTEYYTVNPMGENPPSNVLLPTNGAIDIVDGTPPPPAPGTSKLTPPGSAIYVLIAPGKDGAGAFSLNGSMPTPCPAANSTLDEENCDADAVFRDVPYSES